MPIYNDTANELSKVFADDPDAVKQLAQQDNKKDAALKLARDEIIKLYGCYPPDYGQGKRTSQALAAIHAALGGKE